MRGQDIQICIKDYFQVEILNKHSVGVNYYNKGRLDLKNSQE